MLPYVRKKRQIRDKRGESSREKSVGTGYKVATVLIAQWKSNKSDCKQQFDYQSSKIPNNKKVWQQNLKRPK